MQREWRRYVVFISSTFRDMDFERDAIKLHVIPRLNRYYRNRMVEIQPIDLRLGINTDNMDEAESQNKVLDVCMSCIESAHPFFIGLLGDRYGWIPSEERWNDFISKQDKAIQAQLSQAIGKSVTELEILWGVFNKTKNNRAIFLVRDEASYKNIPKNKLSEFRDAYDDLLNQESRNIKKRRIEELNRKIFDEFGNNKDSWVKYHLDWNNEHGFDGLDEFGNLVAERLIKQIDSELGSQENEYYTWLDYEQQNVRSIMSHNIQHKFPRINDVIPNHGQVLLAGKAGCGKSVLLAQYCEKSKQESSTITLYADVGSSKYSLNIRYIITRWLYELRDSIDSDMILQDEVLLSESTTLQSLYKTFANLVNIAKSQGRIVSIFMDSIERFSVFSPSDLYLVWINPAIQFMGCIDAEMVEKATKYNKQLKVVYMEAPKREELKSLIRYFENEYHIELSHDIRKALSNMSPSFLFLQALFMSLSLLSDKDFLKIRSIDKDPVTAINSYMWNLFVKIPQNEDLIFPYLLHNIAERVSSSKQIKAFEYLSLAPMGLRESDIENIMGEDWNSIEFYTIANLLSNMLIEDPAQHHWRIANRHFSKTLVPKTEQKNMFEVIASAIGKNNDYERERSWGYYIIKAEQSEYAEQWLSDEELCYKKSGQMSRKYHLPISYLWSDADFLVHIQNIVQKLSNANKVSFIANLVLYGWRDKIFAYPETTVRLISMLDEIDSEKLAIERYYELASLYKEMTLIYSHIFKDVEKELIYTEKAVHFYRRCYDMSAKFEDSKNMLVAMSSTLITIYTKVGYWDKIESTYSEIQHILAQ